MTRIALLQMTAGIDPTVNAQTIVDAARAAAEGGAAMLFTPEMSNLIDRDRSRAVGHIVFEEFDPTLNAARDIAAKQGIWIALGSLAIARDDGRWANRSFVIDNTGKIAARYDKIHMFDVDLGSGETWRESNAYAAGEGVSVVETPIGRLGLAICYDIRFPALFAALGDLRCDVISIPAAFTVPTGRDHWHIMQRARAIEATAFVVSAAQVGLHQDGRSTFGHSLVVDPWGQVLLDMEGEQAGLAYTDINLQRIADVRAQLPSLANRRAIVA